MSYISLREIYLRTIRPINLKYNIKVLSLDLYTHRNVHAGYKEVYLNFVMVASNLSM